MSQSQHSQHPILTDLLGQLDASQLEVYEERAAIFEFEAGIDRPLAEALALLDVIKAYCLPPRHPSD